MLSLRGSFFIFFTYDPISESYATDGSKQDVLENLSMKQGQSGFSDNITVNICDQSLLI